MNNPVVTRIAPSPTGQMHIGTLRTALFNYLFAKQHGGTFFARIEDTDKERSQSQWTEAVWEDFTWCGIIPDKKYIQSEHEERHTKLLQELVLQDKAYISKERAKDGSEREVEVVRLRNSGKKITFTDLIRGEVTFDTEELGDFVIARSIDDPLYHFAVVVDDEDAKVTHIFRGEDHISNTPRQILIQEALGFSRPEYGHIPLILAPDRSKLSKRKHGASIENYRKQGYLPEAMINYLALLGWNPGTEEEIFSFSELVKRFSLLQIQKSGAIFDEMKLRWMNREYLKQMPIEERERYLLHFLPPSVKELPQYSEERFLRALPDLFERIHVGEDLKRMFEKGELDYLFSSPEYEKELLPNPQSKKEDGIQVQTRGYLEDLLSLVGEFSEHLSPEKIKEKIMFYAEERGGEKGRGKMLWPLRFSLSGKEKSSDPFILIHILGKEETKKRIEKAISLLFD